MGQPSKSIAKISKSTTKAVKFVAGGPLVIGTIALFTNPVANTLQIRVKHDANGGENRLAILLC